MNKAVTRSATQRRGPVYWLLYPALFTSYVAMAAAVVAGAAVSGSTWVGVFAVAAALCLVTESVIAYGGGPQRAALARVGANEDLRFQVRAGLLAAAILVGAAVPEAAVVIAVAVTVHLCVATYKWLGHRTRVWYGDPDRWRNLDVDGHTEGPPPVAPPVPDLRGRDGHGQMLSLEMLVFIGAGLAYRLRVPGLLLVCCALTAAGALVYVLAALRRFALVRRGPSGAVRDGRLRAAVESLAPEVVVYLSSPASSIYAINVWLELIDRLRRPTLIILRERGNLDVLGPASTPVVVAPKSTDVEFLQTPSMRLVLYPGNTAKNSHMLRLPGLRHAFIHHGESDKMGSASPLARVYDEVWVTGQAPKDRYLAVDEGVRAEQVRIVGRPQLARLMRDRDRERAGDAPLTVLYAPTWEGYYEQADYSSVATMGVDIVRGLLDAGVRVLVKPHPATGQRSEPAAAARAELERLAVSTPAGELLADAGQEALYSAFLDCDVLVTDVSSVLIDFLATHKPYLVTNPGALELDEFHRRYPSSAGGLVLDPARGPGRGRSVARVAELVSAADSPDLRARRAELAGYLLADDGRDPAERFIDEVDAAVDRAEAALTAAARHRVPASDGTPAVVEANR